MTPVFADTSFFVALLNPNDQWAAVAHQQAAALSRPLVTSWWVLVETASLLRHPANRHLFGELVDRLKRNTDAEIVPLSDDNLNRAVELYRKRKDKAWSLTDCTSFILMEDFQINEALTADRHFEQAGFTLLLK